MMDMHLANELKALGTSIELRRRNLHNLVSSLELFEIRELGDLIASTIASVDNRMDILGGLAVELRLQIAQYIDGTDVINFLNVSTTWRALWLQEDMIRFITRRWMPGFAQYYRQKEEITSTRQDIPRLFYEAARRLRTRSLGEFRSIVVETQGTPGIVEDEYGIGWHIDKNLTLDPELHPPRNDGKSAWVDLLPNGTNPLEIKNVSPYFLYSKGRVAWRPTPQQPFGRHVQSLQDLYRGLIVVDNLYNRLRKAFRMPDVVMRGGAVELVALGDKLVVGALGRTLCAWDLETNDYGSVSLPSSGFRCETHGHYVYIYPRHHTGDFWIYAWKFRQDLRGLDTEPLVKATEDPHRQPGDKTSWRCVGILPHPLLDATIFVVGEQRGKLRRNTISLRKYTQGVYSNSHMFRIPEEDGFIIQQRLSERLAPINPFGKYAVAVLERNLRCPSDQRGFEHQAVRLLCFDTIDESFSMETYHIPRWGLVDAARPPDPEITWWNGQLTASARVARFAELEEFAGLENYERRTVSSQEAGFPFGGECKDYLATTRESSRTIYDGLHLRVPVHIPHVSSGAINGRETKRAELNPARIAALNSSMEGYAHAEYLLRCVYPIRTRASSPYPPEGEPQALWADEDFIIFRYIDGGYVAWGFGTPSPTRPPGLVKIDENP